MIDLILPQYKIQIMVFVYDIKLTAGIVFIPGCRNFDLFVIPFELIGK
jgi:hypothetical protein